MGGSLSIFIYFRLGALTFFDRLGLRVEIGPLVVPEVICRDYWMMFDKLAEIPSVFLFLLSLLIRFYDPFFYLDIILANLGNLLIYCC